MEQHRDPGSNHQFNQSGPYTGWDLLKSYWQSKQKFSAYLFFIVITLMTICLVGFDVLFNYWYNYFYNALQAYDKHAVIRLLFIFFIIAAFNIVVAVYRYYISQILGLRWRNWLTHKFVGRWLEKRGYYYLENFDERTDNPDQRIQEDIGLLVTESLGLYLGIINAVTTFIAFIYILWQLSGMLSIPLGGYGSLQIPGYLLWVALIYSLIGTYFTFKIGYPLVSLNFEQQRREASFRFAAVDVRSHAENVALYKGEHHQKGILYNLFRKVLDNWYLIILRQKLLLWFTAGYNQASVVLPLVVALPNYFNKVFLLGGLIQTLSAFRNVQESLSFLVNSYTQIAQWRAVVRRLTTFMNHLAESEEKAKQENKVVRRKHPENSIITKEVTIKTPRDELLLSNINEDFDKGKHYLVKGKSGIGKSTFVRTIAGIWPFAAGEVILPKDKELMYLSQKPYMPIGTLAEAILFPDKKLKNLEKKLGDILHLCRLEHLIPRLYEVAPWSEQLSPGEQQRIAFARVLLHKPDWVFLDESTSMLDIGNEEYFYKLLKSKLPETTVVSVGHRPSLDSFHDHIINLAKYSKEKTLTA